MPWDPDSGVSFGEWMRGGQPLGEGRTADVVVGERTWVTRDQPVEGRTEDGSRFKTVRDQNGHDVTDRTGPDGRERRDVRINLR